MNKILAMILCATMAQSSDLADFSEFILSYKAVMQNNTLLGEEFNIATALTKTENYEVLGVCEIDFKDSQESQESAHDSRESAHDSLEFTRDSRESQIRAKATLRAHKDEVIECLRANLPAKVRDWTRSINNTAQSKTTFSIPPQRILADFSNGQIAIQIIGKKAK